MKVDKHPAPTLPSQKNKRNSETKLQLNSNLRNRQAFMEYAKSTSLITEKFHGKI